MMVALLASHDVADNPVRNTGSNDQKSTKNAAQCLYKNHGPEEGRRQSALPPPHTHGPGLMEEEDNKPISCQEMEEFLAAGILPFARSQDGAVMFFLGKELAKGPAGRNKYVWSDFGGKREGRDESAHDTASREFSEETLGLWGGMGTLAERIGRSYASMRTLLTPQADAQAPSAFVLKNGLYINFLVEMPYLDPLLFQLARDDNDACLPGADPGSATIRAAEKRDWTWVEGTELMERVEGGSCRLRDVSFKRIHLLPRLALTLRAHLRTVLDSLETGRRPRSVLVVDLQCQSRCLHMFGVRAGLTEAELKDRFGHVVSATLYADRTGQPNIFLLFNDEASAAEALAGMRDARGGAWCAWADPASVSVEFAWFEGVGEDERRGDGMSVLSRKRHASRIRKLGVGVPTAPWAVKSPKHRSPAEGKD